MGNMSITAHTTLNHRLGDAGSLNAKTKFVASTTLSQNH